MPDLRNLSLDELRALVEQGDQEVAAALQGCRSVALGRFMREQRERQRAKRGD
jgi:hypothetical protein